MRTILFLCTGNYYRSRSAEELFNFSAPATCPDWRAISRGVAIDLGVDNVGPIAREAAEALEARGIATFDRTQARMPEQASVADLDRADHIVALDRSEHLPLLRERFADWLRAAPADRIEWWHVHDVDQTAASEALPHIAREVAGLMAPRRTGRRLPASRHEAPGLSRPNSYRFR